MPDRSRTYMSKRNRACDYCRAKKAACRIDRGAPCYLCTLHKKECTFLHPASKPRRYLLKQTSGSKTQQDRPVSYSEPQFTSLPVVMDESAQYETLMPTDNNGANDAIQASPVGLESLFENNNDVLSDDFEDGIWQTGFSPGNIFFHSLDMPLEARSRTTDSSLPPAGVFSPVLPSGNETAPHLDTQDVMTPYLLGSSGDMDPSLLNRYQYGASGTFHFKNLRIHSVTQESSPVQFLLSEQSMFAAGREETGCTELSLRDLQQELESLVSPDIGLRLIELYKRIIAPHYPIFFSHDQPNPNNSPPYLLASVYLIVQPFTKFDDKLCVDLAYDRPSGAALYKIINKAIMHETHAPRLSIVQSMLLLAIRPFSNPISLESAFKWSQLTSLVACAHALGLHLDPTLWKIPPWQVAQRRYLSYCIYSVDKWLALSLGRPPLLNLDTWLVKSPNRDDHLFSELDPLAWSRIIKQAELVSLLDRVLVHLYSPRAMSIFLIDQKQVLKSAELLLEYLHEWTRDVDFASPGQSRPTALQRVVEMNYHYIHLTICRSIMRPFIDSDLNDAISPDYAIACEQARRKAKDCLIAAAEFIQDLRTDDLEVLWPAWSVTGFSSICFQILLMAVSSPNRCEATEWVACLRKVRKDMRLKAEALPFLRLALLRIDSIFWKGIHNVLLLKDHVSDAFSSGSC
ncbi:uncharacterized protein N7503_000585 [Penicillium pulvis]|uniref:uncharacterized protein n=1 Tax=Penicillium pulvis TaxID=1562058 RepID=UPI0025467549|nr:uncharacterized protein N7503_000585 [Penicillium pulvis]KAJ5813835.1 hypothetical protein N7503_000585 [Penicillium pulvis]